MEQNMKNNQVVKESRVPARFIREDGSILDFTGPYEVSNYGRVYSLNYHHTGKPKELSLVVIKCNDGTIAHHVALCKDKKQYALQVHRLVLSSFKENEYFEDAVVDHLITRTKTICDDRLSNLRWVTYKQNSNTEHCTGALSKTLTNRHDQSKKVKVTDLSTGAVTIYPSANEAGRTLGVCPTTPAACISQCNGYYKKLNLHFEYV